MDLFRIRLSVLYLNFYHQQAIFSIFFLGCFVSNHFGLASRNLRSVPRFRQIRETFQLRGFRLDGNFRLHGFSGKNTDDIFRVLWKLFLFVLCTKFVTASPCDVIKRLRLYLRLRIQSDSPTFAA